MARKYMTFKDGHEEDILYMEESENGVLFSTSSGIYRFLPPREKIQGTYFIREPSKFVRVTTKGEAHEINIDSITIDERVAYEYSLQFNGGTMGGEILTSPNSDDKTICQLIIERLGVRYRKKD